MADDLIFKDLPQDLRDAAALVQRHLGEALSECDARASELKKEHDSRKLTATILKVISVISGLVIASGLAAGVPAQVLGGAITGIAALERVFANMSHLLAVAAAKAAYDRTRRQVEAEHNRQIIKVVEIRDREPEKSAKLLIKVVGELRNRLAKARDEIETNLAANAYENLGRLTLEEQKATEPSS
jgi:hypothetical protein